MAKEPENIPATHRTEAVKGLWYEAYGKPIVERNRMFVLFLLILLAFISLSWTIILLIPRHVDVPWTVPVNPKTGEPYQLHEFYYLHRKLLNAARLPWIPFRDLARRCMEVEI